MVRATTDYLQDRLTLETSLESFSEMPFRFAEIAKVLLDVYVFHTVSQSSGPHDA